MAAEDDGPNFAYAFGGSAPVSAPSWNPALRPDHESPVKTSFDFPKAHPLAAGSRVAEGDDEEEEEEEEEEDDDLPTAPGPIPERVELLPKTKDAHLIDEVPQSDDDFFDRYGRSEPVQMPVVTSQEPLAPATEWNEQEEARGSVEPVTAESEGVDDAWGSHDVDGEGAGDAPWANQEVTPELNGSRQEDIEDIAEKHAFGFTTHDPRESDETVANTYEYQAESGGLDDSIQESAEAPLVVSVSEEGQGAAAAAAVAGEDWGASDDWEIRNADASGRVEGDAFDFEAGDQSAFEQIMHNEPQQPDMATAVFSTDETTMPTQDAHFAADTGVETSEVLPSTDLGQDQPHASPAAQAVPPAAQSSTQEEWGASDENAFGFGTESAGEAFPDFSSTAPQEVNAPPAEDLADAWAAAMGDDEELLDADAFKFDDDEGFLDDVPIAAVGAAAGATAAGVGAAVITNRHRRSTSTTKYTPTNVPQAGLPPPSRTASYRPDAPNFVDLSKSQQQSPQIQKVPAVSPYASAYQQPTQQRPPISSAESFADKAKGGYHSPYDLPEDLAVKRRRPAAQMQTSAPAVQQTVPPPRLSSRQSMPAMGGPPPKQQSPITPSFPGASPLQQSIQTAPAQTAKLPSRDGGFFADLPMPERPRRQATPSRTYSPQTAATQAPPPLAPPAQIRPASTSYAPPQPPQQAAPVDPANLAQLRPAERMPLYDDMQPLQQQRSTTMPPPSARYSPAPPSQVPTSRSSYSPAPPAQAPVANASRYSPAPGANKLPPNAALRQPSDTAPPVSRAQAQMYAPRTSSPLAQRESPAHAHGTTPQGGDIPPPVKANLTRMGSIASMSGLETVNENAEPTFSPPSRPDAPRHAPHPSSGSSTPPPPATLRSQPSSQVSSPRKRSSYAPTSNYQPMTGASPSEHGGIVPPRRSQTSSPSRGMKAPHPPTASLDRPASVTGLQSPIRTSFNAATVKQPNRMISSSLGGPLYHEMPNLVGPSDTSVQDPLQRWKGAPIFHWGNGSTVLTSFPRYTPLYGSGGAHGSGPVIKPVPGDIKTTTITSICAQSDIFLKFPGPLKKGSKKKDVLAWLKTSADQLEQEHKNASMNGELTTAMHTRSEERILLWRVMALLVEHDGVLEGTPAVELAVKQLLTAETVSEPVSATEDSADRVNASQPEAFDPLAVKALRAHLYAGEREKAVWHAVDRRLWAHALLIASTLNDKEIWKQVVQEFVRKEVRRSTTGENTETAPLAALYQVFAGNWEESIDELVSVSARSGFQMVSTSSGAGATKDALAGLDRWRETLLLVLNNRSAGDAAALASLGNLLNGYGRVEAGHICFLFARANVHFAGADNPEAHFTLLGGHTTTQGTDFASSTSVSLDTILLSEVYEFALPSSAPIPHLQAYKLYHAEVLAESGRRSEAQAYVDAITSIVTAKTARGNPYYNRALVGWMDEFAKRLSQAPARGSEEKSWKPSMDKVSSSIWGRFNTFIAGEDDAAGEGPAGAPALGQSAEQSFTPMAMPPSMPTMGRTVSSSDIGAYGGYQPNGATGTLPAPMQPVAANANSRYAPGSAGAAAYTPRSSSEQSRPKYAPQSQSAYEPRTSTENEFGSPSQGYTPGGAYAPQAAQPLQQSPYAPMHQQQGSPSYLPTPPLEQSAHGLGMNGYASAGQAPSFEAASQPEAEATTSYGYEPSSSSYEPASYTPYQPDDEPAGQGSAEGEKPKKKSFMDDDDEDDLAARAAALKKAQKSEADRVADEAFRKAAEADAAKSKQPLSGANGKPGWFGGWFGGKKQDPNAPVVHKAKLGEESSFVFDKELGRWVNKKGGAEQSTPVAATPPPPKMAGPPSRPASGMHPPLGTPPIKSSSPASVASGPPPPPGSAGSGLGAMPPPQRSASAQPAQAGPVAALAGSGPPSRPPSRPSTSMSNASDIDDLLGPIGGPRKAGAKKGARKGRYVDVMAQK